MLAEEDDVVELLEAIRVATGIRDLRAECDLGGSWSINLKATTSSWEAPVVVRVHPPYVSRERVAAQQTARRVIASRGAPAPLPLPLPRGGAIVSLEDGRVAEVEPYLDAPDRMNTPERLVIGAGMLALVHDALRDAALPPAAKTARFANHLPAENAAERVRAGAERIRSWGDASLTEFADEVAAHVDEVSGRESALTLLLPRQVTHGDWWDNNVLFRDVQVMAVLDMGFMAERARVDDLALPIWFWLLETEHGPFGLDDIRLATRMLDAYDASARKPLSRAERAALPLALARQPAWMVGRWVLEPPDEVARHSAEQAQRAFPRAREVLIKLDELTDAVLAGS